MKFSTPFTLAAATVFVIIGSTDAHLRGRRSLQTDDDCTATHQDPWQTGSHVPCCAPYTEKKNNWDGDDHFYYKCMLNDTGFQCWNQMKQKWDPDCDTGKSCADICHGDWKHP